MKKPRHILVESVHLKGKKKIGIKNKTNHMIIKQRKLDCLPFLDSTGIKWVAH